MDDDPEEWNKRICEIMASLPRPLPSEALHTRLLAIVQAEAGIWEGTLRWTNDTTQHLTNHSIRHWEAIIDYREVIETQEGFPISATYSLHRE